jgi:hypothetical protein|tara:strand:- start:624 stop:782 length:159 start_codon:yes stop_codon:yes gene_type:complete
MDDKVGMRKKLAMGEKISCGKSPVKLNMGGEVKPKMYNYGGSVKKNSKRRRS